MAQVTITVDAGITVEVIEGANQSTEVTALRAQVADLQGKIAAAKTKLAEAATADAAEDAGRAAALAALG